MARGLTAAYSPAVPSAPTAGPVPPTDAGDGGWHTVDDDTWFWLWMLAGTVGIVVGAMVGFAYWI
jgi:hypothetical protein